MAVRGQANGSGTTWAWHGLTSLLVLKGGAQLIQGPAVQMHEACVRGSTASAHCALSTPTG